jgi:hypothetical protein
MKKLTVLPIILLALATAAGSAAKDALPETTTDGLKLVKGTKVRAVYMAEGADLSRYDRLAMLKAYVAFKKDWKREHNREAMTLRDRVSDKDMQRIRDDLAGEFAKVFVEVLEKEGGHQFVKDAGEGVLILRPAIIDLDVTAPDLMQADTRSFAASAGSMTLYMEMYDGKTGAIIAKVIDPEAASDSFVHYANRVTNRAEADRIIRRWARLLNKHLAEVKSSGE